MALPIVEQPLYGEVLIETAPWASPFVWTDRTADLVNGVNYSIGGRVGQPGSSSVDVGTLNATFKDMASVPNVGALIRISFSRVAGYAFVGYVQDVSQRIVFDDSVSYNTPITLTTLNCVDWVGYVGQFQLVGIGGADATTGAEDTNSAYYWPSRIAAINKAIDPTFATKLVYAVSSSNGIVMGDSDMVGTIADHLDLISRTTQTYWYPSLQIPTDTTTGRDNLIVMKSNASLTSSGITFTDVAGSAGNLHYTEIDFENSSQNVANEIVVNNQARFHVPYDEVTKIGGFNQENFVIINGQETVGVNSLHTEVVTDSTSIATYGKRQIEIETNGYISTSLVTASNVNFVSNPSAEYSDDGYSGIASSKVRRRKPSEDASPFAAFIGDWAIRSRISTATGNHRIIYSGGESDGMPVVAGRRYYFTARSARGVASSTNTLAQLRARFYDENETELLLSAGTAFSLTSNNTWYLINHDVVAPANSVRATMEIVFTRSSGANFVVGDKYWGDAFMMTRDYVPGSFYVDGDKPWSSGTGWLWAGGVGASQSFAVYNIIDDIAANNLALYSTTSNRATRIRWNAQESLSDVPTLSVGKTISLVYSGTTTTYRIVGIDGNIDPERYMIDYYLTKV